MTGETGQESGTRPDPGRPAASGELEAVVEYLRSHRPDVVEAVRGETGMDPTRLARGFDLVVDLISAPEPTPERLAAARETSVMLAREGAAAERVLAGLLALIRAAWGILATERAEHPEAVLELADRLLRGQYVVVESLADAYADVEVELAAAHAERRRSVLEELLSAPRANPQDRARIRRHAEGYGLPPDGSYRLTLIEVPDSTDDVLIQTEDALEQAIRAPVPHHRRTPGIRLPVVLEWRGRLLVLARADWVGVPHLRGALVRLLGDAWTAVDMGHVEGFEALSAALAQAEYAVGVAADIGHRGWVGDPGTIALETTFLLDQSLVDEAIEHELGPLLADERMGEELITTLEVHLAARQNIRETARRLHLAPRTVAYRLARIEMLLGSPVEGETSVRLAAALLALRVSRRSRTAGRV
jgi:hypothetical protein